VEGALAGGALLVDLGQPFVRDVAAGLEAAGQSRDP
jgi:hypothetical protein